MSKNRSSSGAKHPIDIPGWEGRLPELAKAISSLRYDRLFDLLDYLYGEVGIQKAKDKTGGKLKLAAALGELQRGLAKACTASEKAWEISEPFMGQKD